MGPLLSLRGSLPSKLPEASAGTVPGDGADRLGGGCGFPAECERPAAGQLATARPLSGRRDLRTRFTDGDGTAGGATGPAAREVPSGSGEPPVGQASPTRTALSVHISLVVGFGCDQPFCGAGRP